MSPSPALTGISFRALPRVTCEEIKKVCKHYEKKGECSPLLRVAMERLGFPTQWVVCVHAFLLFAGAGRYTAEGGRTARFLYDLSHEVVALVEQLEGEVQKQLDERDHKIKHLESMMEEWNTYFGGVTVEKYISVPRSPSFLSSSFRFLFHGGC